MKNDVPAAHDREPENVMTIPATSTIEDAYAIIQSVNQIDFPVVDDNQKTIGIVTRDELLQYFYQQEKEGASVL